MEALTERPPRGQQDIEEDYWRRHHDISKEGEDLSKLMETLRQKSAHLGYVAMMDETPNIIRSEN